MTKEPPMIPSRGIDHERTETQLDRSTPARREACRTRSTGRQTWRELLFVHWEVSVDVLRRLVPAPLSIDTFDGRAYIGLVPFTMHDVRFGPVRVADFLETNLRTYVHAEGVPGVWFFSLDAQSAFAVWGARTFYRLPYFHARMECGKGSRSWDYRLQRSGESNAALDARWTIPEAESHAAAPGTLGHFLTERYALYGSKRNGHVYRLRVHHTAWPLQPARLERLVTTLPKAAGIDVGDPIDLILASAKGVAVETFASERVT